MKFGSHLFDKEATLARLFTPTPEPTADSLIGVMRKHTEEHQMLIDALKHISNTSNSYESRYAKNILEKIEKSC